ncbi:Zinc/iron permease [Violaceomyces palustris]|uniref:Zinc/iron permease n=1 Tax=Violaceomyces palustris TaxID=1673888 RepID=A0ACD0NRM2_9BASI|nr:Zinc/iron permease [Violaceomyces palustris]
MSRPTLSLLVPLLFSLVCLPSSSVVVAINGRPDTQEPSSDVSSVCSDDAAGGSYNIGLHVAAIFVVLVSSSLGITLPIITKSFRQFKSRRQALKTSAQPPPLANHSHDLTEHPSKLDWLDEVFFASKYFGTGIILSTAFVHLLFEAFTELSSECINLVYEPTSPAIAMASLFLIFLVDFALMRHIRNSKKALEALKRRRDQQREEQRALGSSAFLKSDATATAMVDETTPSPKATGDEQTRIDGLLVSDDELAEQERRDDERLRERAKELDCMVIEGGIVFHSVMVGLGLGTAADAGFVPYFIAIVFHQMFDGFAIGTRMAELNFNNKRLKQMVMILAYAFVTPLGIGIGVAVRTTFSPNDPSTIFAIGTLNSISAGVLLYGALVDLLAKEFLFGSMLDASIKRSCTAIGFLLLGSFVMSLLGQWA